MPDEPVAEEAPRIPWNEGEEVGLDFSGIRLGGEAEALGEAADMGVDDDALLEAECVSEHDVGGFAADARKGGEFLHTVRNASPVAFEEGGGAGLEAAGLGPEEPGGFDEGLKFRGGDGGVVCGGFAAFEKAFGDQIDALVSALGGEDGGDQELQGVGVLEFAVGVRVGAAEDGEDLPDGFRGGAGFGAPAIFSGFSG